VDSVAYFVDDEALVEQMNPNHEPSENEEAVLAVLKDQPGSRANAMLLREELDDVSKQQINDALNQLQAAGWVEKVTRGLYDLVDDPREEDV